MTVQGGFGDGRWFSMDHNKATTSTEITDSVSSTFWRQTMLTGCVLAVCLGVIAALVMF
jgi:hypothetical protein